MSKSKVSKRLKEIYSNTDLDKLYNVKDAVELLKNNAKAKFDETIEMIFCLGVDPRHADQMVRGMCTLPNGTGKSVTVAVFAKGDKAKEAEQAGADIVGDDDLVSQIKQGKIEFQRCVATPDMMAKVGSVARILGPKGLMPNPKLGTVTANVKEAVEAAKAGQVEFRVDKNGIVHVGVGKASFDSKALLENITSISDAITSAKPSGAKGTYLKKIYLGSTMGLSINIDIASIKEA